MTTKHVEPAAIDAIMNPPQRVLNARRVVDGVLDGIAPLMRWYHPYVDGLDNLPADGRFLLVGNHTQGGGEALLIPYFVREAIGTRVRPLAERMMGNFAGPAADLFAGYGAVVGAPETARELMQHNESILVFPGGGREISKFKGEYYTLNWEGRAGFARLSVENRYPIVPVALVGGDDVYHSLISRESALGRLSLAVQEKLSGRRGMAPPIMRGVGPTLIPRPQRMYLRFGEPITTDAPDDIEPAAWVLDVKQRTQSALEQAMADLQRLRDEDPYRRLNPFGWRSALRAPRHPQ